MDGLLSPDGCLLSFVLWQIKVEEGRSLAAALSQGQAGSLVLSDASALCTLSTRPYQCFPCPSGSVTKIRIGCVISWPHSCFSHSGFGLPPLADDAIADPICRAIRQRKKKRKIQNIPKETKNRVAYLGTHTGHHTAARRLPYGSRPERAASESQMPFLDRQHCALQQRGAAGRWRIDLRSAVHHGVGGAIEARHRVGIEIQYKI
ncbi:hypothetical protein B0H67DRAFT_119126 [Lasiosphaeris hirsuta]|uniref:Uncharacterized protein n=1 Tax=Lasiosphaeris hirsuta TaxID=260670 RepID=A0AA40AZT8_9PEZI|nr:hypothetical protein B0H67DRAFT_119126 [Lasiosphaeris hirsuta]